MAQMKNEKATVRTGIWLVIYFFVAIFGMMIIDSVEGDDGLTLLLLIIGGSILGIGNCIDKIEKQWKQKQ